MIEHIYVIVSSTFEPDRLCYLKKYFTENNLEIKITFFEAIYKYRDENKLENRYTNNLVLGEKCLLQNYINLYKHILMTDYNTVLILESDVLFTNNFKDKLYTILNEFKNLNENNAMCFLGNACNLKYNENNKKTEHLYLQMSSSCTDSMILTRKAIENILNEMTSKIISKPADHLLNDIILNKNIKAYWCIPPIIIQGSANGTYKPSVKDRY